MFDDLENDEALNAVSEFLSSTTPSMERDDVVFLVDCLTDLMSRGEFDALTKAFDACVHQDVMDPTIPVGVLRWSFICRKLIAGWPSLRDRTYAALSVREETRNKVDSYMVGLSREEAGI